MTIAGGIMGALFHREKTGETTEVDVSLLGVGMWSMGAAIALSLQMDVPWRGMPPGATTGNPLTGNYRTKDDRFVALTCLQMGKYWPEACEVLGVPELATDERFADHASLAAHAAEATELLRARFLERTAEEWREELQRFSGQWAMVQDTLEAAADPQSVANGYVRGYQDVDGHPYQLASPPVHFGGEPPEAKRAPGFNEHGDEILESLGLDWDRIVDLKVRGVVT
jgi:crotonobetainyl-CoA:carnitine CoA-transferase CaiB-like acyl-CoA transferase